MVIETRFEHLFSTGEFNMRSSYLEETKITPKIRKDFQSSSLNAASKNILFEYYSVHPSLSTKLCGFQIFQQVSSLDSYLTLSQSAPSGSYCTALLIHCLCFQAQPHRSDRLHTIAPSFLISGSVLSSRNNNVSHVCTFKCSIATFKQAKRIK